ncbi:hypothetical protein SAMN05880574_105107 [Chryseobacterium sp. RU37D]|uniref:hypothetical protein n=1 Tax=Chryseobacterium sp. RU37D TaxID=1907397 RepID=UPI0009552FBF|nr:hypothetical protein [Chryseobacterium sp. RU37D]SIQ09336.1 hypothetical protein SAMN05880574_105107 [Chryseobacterium sp. RU37D]
MRKWVKKLFVGLAILLGVVLLANFGLNIWLKTQLPNYIKNNTDYKISYKLLEVDLMSGNILSTGVSVNSKNPQNINVIGIQGTIDTLKISRFGIYDAVFNKQINSTDLLLSKPNLNIVLARPVDNKTGKKRNLVVFENIRINNGSISIFRHNKRKFLSVQDLNLFVENLQMTEESVENKLPVVFDKYKIRGKNFFVRPDAIYVLKIKSIVTSDGQMSVEDFRLIPLLNIVQLKRFYPKKTKLYQVRIPIMKFTDIVLKKNIVSLANANFQHPNLLVYNIDVGPVKIKKSSGFDLNLEDVRINNATVKVVKSDGNELFFAKNLNLNANKLKFNKDTREEVIPVGYKSFQFSGKDIVYSTHQNYNIENLALNQKSGEMRNISVTPNKLDPGRRSMNLKASFASFNINKFEFIDRKLHLDIKDLLVDKVNGTIRIGEKIKRKTKKENNVALILVRKFSLKNSNVTYDKDSEPLAFNELNATINNVEYKSKTNNYGHTLKIGDYFVTTKNFGYRTKFYNMSVGLLKLNKNNVQINNFAMKPLVSRMQFIKMIPVERDLYDIKANQISASGNWDLFSENKSIMASNVMIQSADANIFRSKIPKDDPKEKPLYSRMLRSIKIPLIINDLDLKNSVLVYEEDTPESVGPGKLTFSNFNMNVKNLNSAKTKGKPTKVDIRINCSFMNLAPLSVSWDFDVADQRDVFNISGRTLNLPAQGINPFIRPYLHVTATGMIQEMIFNFRGNPKGLNGRFNLRHKDLKVAILDKKNQEKKGFLTAIANLVVKSDSGKLPQDVMIEDVERDPAKSFFNMFWKGIEQGLKKTLIGINIDKAPKKSTKNN